VDTLVERSSWLKLSKQIYEFFIQKQMNSLPTKWSEIITNYFAARDKSVSIFIATAVRTSHLVNVVLFLSHILKSKSQSICTIKWYKIGPVSLHHQLLKIMPVHLSYQLLQTYTRPFAPSTVENCASPFVLSTDANLCQSICTISCFKLMLVHFHH
jgi:hypothetical protein